MNDTSEFDEKGRFKLKITLIGSSGVGKSSLIFHFINNSYNEIKIATIGCDKFNKIETIRNQDIILNIWDTAGQERFRSLSPMFIKNSDICILIYDITNEDSFNDLKKYWLDLVRNNLSNIIIGVVANKIDLYAEEVVNEQTGRSFAEKEALFFYMTSAKEYESIKNLFIDLANKYIDKYGFVHNYYNTESSIIKQQESKDSIQLRGKKKIACCN